MRPMSVDGRLRFLDKHLEAAGASRELIPRGDKMKSNVRLLCLANRVLEFERRVTEYVRGSCRVNNDAEAGVVSGTIHGGICANLPTFQGS